jgi:hypothetical protein
MPLVGFRLTRKLDIKLLVYADGGNILGGSKHTI